MLARLAPALIWPHAPLNKIVQNLYCKQSSSNSKTSKSPFVHVNTVYRNSKILILTEVFQKVPFNVRFYVDERPKHIQKTKQFLKKIRVHMDKATNKAKKVKEFVSCFI